MYFKNIIYYFNFHNIHTRGVTNLEIENLTLLKFYYHVWRFFWFMGTKFDVT